jgi:ligand-binding sensor domain-containing protein/serine phosphatase RsbU (regulator of sigma subunit)
MRKFVFCTALLLLNHFSYLAGQIKIPDIKIFTVSDDLSQSNVNVVIQDSHGFLWIGTEDGLNRYDGYEFVCYAHQPNDSNSLSNNFINAVCEAGNGLLWVATNNGLNSIDLKSGKIKTYFHNAKKVNSLSDNMVLNVFIDNQKVLWVKTLKSLDKFDPEKETFTRYSHYNDIFYYASSNITFPILEDSKSRMWVGTKDGLNFFDRDLQLFNRYISLDFNPNSITDNEIRCMVKDNRGKVWIGTAKGLNEFDPDKKIFKRYYVEKDNKLSNNNRINTLYIDKDSILWIGTDGGLFYLTAQRERFYQPGSDNNLFHLPIYSITSDKSGILWMGSNKGLIKLGTHEKKFQAFRTGDIENKVSILDVGSMLVNNKNSLWIGTLGKGLALLDLTTKKITTYNLSKNGEDRNNYIHYIYKVSPDNIFLGTNNGVLIFNSLNGNFQSLCQDIKATGCELLYQNRVNAILEDVNKKIWIATSYGLFCYDRISSSIIGYFNNPEDPNSLCNNKVYTLIQDKGRYIWVGTDNGLDRLDPISKTFIHFAYSRDGKSLLSSNSVYSLKFDANGMLWVGTVSGLNRFDPKSNSVTMITEKQGLSDNLIYAIEIDRQKNVWVSTNRGINRIVPGIWDITSFDINDGLQDYEFNLNSSCKNSDGELFFGGVSGLNLFHPDSLFRNNFIPPIVITSIEVITTKENIFRQNLINDEIIVPHRTKILTINFASLDYTMPEKNYYAYKLYSVNEKEPDWIYLGKTHSATLTNLKPGEYKFKVKGSNSDKVWNETGITINLKVESPFWLKPQAIYIYIFIGIIFLLGIYRYRTFSLRKSNRILKEKELASYKIERQRELLEIKNRNITDSINYAKRIQEALMPSGKIFSRILPESFVFHQPKDIVSGDFFWISERGNKIFVAAVDCTGHGVPGAFMSIIGFELFRKITHNQGIENPSQILSILNKEFEEIFNDVDDYVMRDGMDIAFCVIDKTSKLLEYSGAVNPIYLIRDDKITEISGSRFSVGLDNIPEADRSFDNKQIMLQDDDVIYLFSDGYADQFGGPEGKKFKYRRFRHLLLTIHKYPMEEQYNLLSERINRWKGDYEQVDDMLIIGFKPVFNN